MPCRGCWELETELETEQYKLVMVVIKQYQAKLIFLPQQHLYHHLHCHFIITILATAASSTS